MRLRPRHFLSAIDAKFALGVVGLAMAFAISVEAGRTLSAAYALRSALVEAGQAALQSWGERPDEVAATEAALATFKDSGAASDSAVLASVALDPATGSLVLEGSIPIEVKMLAPLGLPKIEIARRMATRLSNNKETLMP